MKIGIAQLNPVVGDIEGNVEKIKSVFLKLKGKVDLIVFPELFLTGYPPRDLLERKEFIKITARGIKDVVNISKKSKRTGILFGTPAIRKNKKGKGLSNTALLVYNGKIVFRQDKSLLPYYDVFDETRYFEPAKAIKVFNFKDERLGILICEDAWGKYKINGNAIYKIDPAKILAEKGASIFINIAASPFQIDKDSVRYKIIRDNARAHKLPFIFVNQVGGNDELIFDGRSMFIDPKGMVVKVLPAFKEHIAIVNSKAKGKGKYTCMDRIKAVHDALILGIKDYMRKCGFSKAVVALSGGIDSSLTAYLATKAIGSKNVLGLFMPSPYTSKESKSYVKALAKNLGIELKIVPITPIYQAYKKSLKKELKIGRSVDKTLENLQARIRGNVLMAFSNKYGYLVLSTGNKSELAVGYCTLYGDLTGGLAVLADVPKTMVYKLANYVNSKK
ncbi:MAG TPA: NAD+ synthase, partial [Candidatus Aenigmarchaeota archaeon]|nr:NAD+ synthase [Candidatus Aenigmarchaeota archaeon]